MRSIADIFRSYGVLDADGRHINGTDKMTNHSYGNAYEGLFLEVDPNIDPSKVPTQPHIKIDRCFRSTRHKVKLVMEIGVADGSCLLAWREVFPNATIVGMDIHHSDKAHGDRIEFHIGHQRYREDCERVVDGRQFDLIVEDATHKLDNTLLTLFWMWPHIRPGGLYIVEEWEDAAGERDRIHALWPNVEIIGTCGPHIQDEPLIVFRKPQ